MMIIHNMWITYIIKKDNIVVIFVITQRQN